MRESPPVGIVRGQPSTMNENKYRRNWHYIWTIDHMSKEEAHRNIESAEKALNDSLGGHPHRLLRWATYGSNTKMRGSLRTQENASLTHFSFLLSGDETSISFYNSFEEAEHAYAQTQLA